MDPRHFDGLVRSLAQPASRRRAVSLVIGGALALVGEAAPGVAKDRRHGAAKPRRHGKTGSRAKPTCGKAGATCALPSDCCSNLDCLDAVCGKAAGGCPSGQRKCGGSCCPAVPNGTPTCAKGTCGFTCDDGFTACDASCVDASTLCGGLCGNVCGAGETCCGFSCVDTSSDGAHCGTCARRCGTGTTCASGSCTPDACGTCPQYTAASDAGACFWLNCSTPNGCCWVPAPILNGGDPYTETTCEAQDQCSSGQACYKWGAVSCTA